jgi:hypothetical protein
MHNHNIAVLREFAGEPLIGVILQELTIMAAEPKIVSDTGSGGIVRFESHLQDTKPNRNKRLYNEDVLTHAISAPAVQERLRTRTMYGEANHPFTTDLARQMIIDQTRISHIVTGLDGARGGVVRGQLETAATACGRDMRGLIVENKSTVAFSMRGMGGVRKVQGQDLVEVTKPLALVTYDWVTFPSHSGAYMDTASMKNEGACVVTMSQAAEYARDQSANVRSLVEQFELEGVEYSLDESQMNMIVKSSQAIVKVFLEADIRSEFRGALLSL